MYCATRIVHGVSATNEPPASLFLHPKSQCSIDRRELVSWSSGLFEAGDWERSTTLDEVEAILYNS